MRKIRSAIKIFKALLSWNLVHKLIAVAAVLVSAYAFGWVGVLLSTAGAYNEFGEVEKILHPKDLGTTTEEHKVFVDSVIDKIKREGN